MALVPYEPFRHLDNMRREWDRFFTQDFPLFPAGGSAHWGAGHLNIDVFETENEVVATCDIPGLEKKEDVHIDVDRDMLTISGTLNRSGEAKDENMHRRERFIGRFQRSVSLPAHVSPEGVKATYKNGVLDIRMPKMQGDTKKRIDVQFH